jgi:hypothetical protein
MMVSTTPYTVEVLMGEPIFTNSTGRMTMGYGGLVEDTGNLLSNYSYLQNYYASFTIELHEVTEKLFNRTVLLILSSVLNLVLIGYFCVSTFIQ